MSEFFLRQRSNYWDAWFLAWKSWLDSSNAAEKHVSASVAAEQRAVAKEQLLAFKGYFPRTKVT